MSGDNKLQAVYFGLVSQAKYMRRVVKWTKYLIIYVQPLTCQGALSESARRGDSYRVIDNPLTCQGALCS